MKLQTIVLDLSIYPEKPENRKIAEWIEQLHQEYTVKNMSAFRVNVSRKEREKDSVSGDTATQRSRVQSFFLGNGIRKEDALFVSDQRAALIAAQELGIAVLACELSVKEGEGFPLVAQRVWENDNDFFLKCYQREHGLPWEILRTEHLILREECEEDLDRIYAMYEQPHITRFLEPPYPEREKEREYIRNYRQYVYCYYGFGLWHVIDKQTGLSAGRAGLNPKTYSDGVVGVELGYMIVEPFLRKGYCMEICEAIVQYAKEVLELEELYCLIRPDNTVSIHIAEALGFKFEQKIEDSGRIMWRYHCNQIQSWV